jgi:hypothetical protein
METLPRLRHEAKAHLEILVHVFKRSIWLSEDSETASERLKLQMGWQTVLNHLTSDLFSLCKYLGTQEYRDLGPASVSYLFNERSFLSAGNAGRHAPNSAVSEAIENFAEFCAAIEALYKKLPSNQAPLRDRTNLHKCNPLAIDGEDLRPVLLGCFKEFPRAKVWQELGNLEILCCQKLLVIEQVVKIKRHSTHALRVLQEIMHLYLPIAKRTMEFHYDALLENRKAKFLRDYPQQLTERNNTCLSLLKTNYLLLERIQGLRKEGEEKVHDIEKLRNSPLLDSEVPDVPDPERDGIAERVDALTEKYNALDAIPESLHANGIQAMRLRSAILDGNRDADHLVDVGARLYRHFAEDLGRLRVLRGHNVALPVRGPETANAAIAELSEFARTYRVAVTSGCPV